MLTSYRNESWRIFVFGMFVKTSSASSVLKTSNSLFLCKCVRRCRHMTTIPMLLDSIKKERMCDTSKTQTTNWEIAPNSAVIGNLAKRAPPLLQQEFVGELWDYRRVYESMTWMEMVVYIRFMTHCLQAQLLFKEKGGNNKEFATKKKQPTRDNDKVYETG